MNESQILDTVTEHLSRYKASSGIHLDISQRGVRKDGDWWYVVVLPDPPDSEAHKYNEIMSEVEDEIEREEHLKVLLVPAMPD